MNGTPAMSAPDSKGEGGGFLDEGLDARLVELSLSLFGDGGSRVYQNGECLVGEGAQPGGIWLVAARIGNTRLIDNLEFVLTED